MYMYEIGRLYNMFDEEGKALECVREASEILLRKPSNTVDPIFTQIQHQDMLLKANMFDQGLVYTEYLNI